MAGQPIHLNPEHKGKFRRKLNLKPDQPITNSALHKALHAKSRETREEAHFVVNARGWNKKR